MSVRVPKLFTVEEYLVLEGATEERNEFVDGVIYGMTGGTASHARIQANLMFSLRRDLSGNSYEALGSDFKVRIEARNLVTYPDVTVYSGGIKFFGKTELVGTNPTVIFEVLSPSTAAYDLGDKREAYQTLPSIKDYIVVHQEEAKVERWSRNARGTFTHATATKTDVLIPSLELRLAFTDIYARVDVL